MVRLGSALLGLPLLLAAPPVAGPTSALAGHYYHQFPNGTVDGQTYTGENVVEIVPVSSGAAYVRASLSFFNGHSCEIRGVAQARGAALVYRERGDDDGAPCVLTVSRVGRSLRLDDGADHSCDNHCGARGSLSRIDLPFASRRPIRYMAVLKRSKEYRAAMSEWRR